MTPPSTFELYRSTWAARKTTPENLKALQMERLNAIVQYARRHSKVFAERFAGLPETITDPCQLPVVSKAELMPRFGDWATGPAIKRSELEQFVHGLEKITQPCLGKNTITGS